MATPRIMVCAEGIVKDSRRNNITIYNLYEELSAEGFPIFIQKFFVFLLFDREEGEGDNFEFDLIFLNNDQQVATKNAQINFNDSQRNRAIFEINGLVINSPGEFKVECVHEEEVLSSYWIEVKNLKDADIEQQADGE